MVKRLRLALVLLFTGLVLTGVVFTSSVLAQSYKGPRPPKTDVVYLQHASTLIPTEVADARQDSKKGTYSVPGAASTARTPLAEPIFIMESDRISAESLELYKLDVKNGQREVSMSQKRVRGGPRPIRVSVTRLERGLYRLEAAETLENGEYALSAGSDKMFCFEVY
jgi:hypothetical protein